MKKIKTIVNSEVSIIDIKLFSNKLKDINVKIVKIEKNLTQNNIFFITILQAYI